MIRKFFYCSLLIAVCSLNFAAEPEFTIKGWDEAVVSVSNLDAHQLFFTEIAAWTMLEQGKVSRTQLDAWQLPKEARADFRLFGNAGTASGQIRLVKFINVEQQPIRLDAQSWDTGGIFDLNVRVKNLDAIAKKVRAVGWQANAPVTHFDFGPFTVKEWIVKSPDGLAFAMIERIKPQLEGWPHLKSMSRSFNSTQLVRDMPKSLKFYRDTLGFKPYLEHQGASEKAGENVLGLPHNLTTEIPRNVYILHPQGLNEGSVELLSFDGADGSDFSQRAHMPNLGIVALRFQVTNIESLQRHLQDNDITLIHPVTLIDGKQALTAQAPEGAWLEFYQPESE